MFYTDLHMHALWGVDDGAKTEAEMLAMVRKAYDDGTRHLCLTPHFHPGYFGDNREKVQQIFGQLTSICGQELPELKLALGNELRYNKNCVSWLRDGACLTLNGTRNVLVDFLSHEERITILRGIDRLLSHGYVPVLAHVERYRTLTMDDIRKFSGDGVLLQVDAGALRLRFGLWVSHRAKAILSEGLAYVIGSDAHGEKDVCLSSCYKAIKSKFTEQFARELCCENGIQLLWNAEEGR